MMTINAIIVQMLEMAGSLLERSVIDLTDEQWLHRPGEGLDSAAWLVGHAVLVDRQILEELDVVPLPPLPDHWFSSYQHRPDGESFAVYDDGASVLAHFVVHRRALIATVAHIPPDSLDRELDPPGRERYNPLRTEEVDMLFDYRTVGEMVRNMAISYTAQLVGELSLVRQSLDLAAIDDDW